MRFSLPELSLFALAAVLLVEALLGRALLGELPRWSRPGGPSSAILASWTITPGVVNPDVTQATIVATICRRGWTRTIRPPVNYTTDLKRRGLSQYRLRGPPSRFQEDHLISLELGGHPTDPRNLWPEPYPRAAVVDQTENELNAEVCSGKLSLVDAQRRESLLKHTTG
jgi:hypothetical protein